MSKPHITFAYSGASHVTGRKLWEALKDDPRVNVTKVRKNRRVKHTNLFIRWGNTRSFSPENTECLNTQEATLRASDKGAMMRALVNDPKVNTPEVFFPEDTLFQPKDGTKLYIRGRNNVVRYGETLRSTDKYATLPIKNKRREYRVHVFKDSVVAIYEKVPQDDSVTIYKDNNCKFARRDPAWCKLTKEGQQMAIQAVKTLGLDFGGVDVALTWNEEEHKVDFVVIEVNSSPGLNSLNVQRWADMFVEEVITKGDTEDA